MFFQSGHHTNSKCFICTVNPTKRISHSTSNSIQKDARCYSNPTGPKGMFDTRKVNGKKRWSQTSCGRGPWKWGALDHCLLKFPSNPSSGIWASLREEEEFLKGTPWHRHIVHFTCSVLLYMAVYESLVTQMCRLYFLALIILTITKCPSVLKRLLRNHGS